MATASGQLDAEMVRRKGPYSGEDGGRHSSCVPEIRPEIDSGRAVLTSASSPSPKAQPSLSRNSFRQRTAEMAAVSWCSTLSTLAWTSTKESICRPAAIRESFREEGQHYCKHGLPACKQPKLEQGTRLSRLQQVSGCETNKQHLLRTVHCAPDPQQQHAAAWVSAWQYMNQLQAAQSRAVHQL